MSAPRLLAFTFVLASSPALAAPNETCAEAQILPVGVLTHASTDDVSSVQAPTSCGVDDEHALWFSFTAPTTDPYVFTTLGSALDTTLAVYDGCDAEPLACNDDDLQSLQSELDLYLEQGKTYLIRVGGWGSQRGDFVLRVHDVWHRHIQPNDLCEDAIELSMGGHGSMDTRGATGVDLSSCGPEDSVDLWYTFVAPEAGRYDFTLTQQQLSAHFVSVHESCDGGGELACGFFGTSAELAANQRVYLRVGTNPIVADNFNLNVGPVSYPEPPNDTHLGALPVTVPSTTVGTTRGAHPEAMHWGLVCGAYVNAAVWYSFEAPADGVYIFDTEGSVMEDTVVAVFAECDEQGEVVPHLWECNDNDGVGRHGRLEGFLEGGTKVCLAVAGRHLSEQGDFRLNVSTPLPAPDNDACAKSKRLDIDTITYGQNYSATPVVPSGVCPISEFALWYRFTAPADGVYKFDVKASRESSPDLAVYDDCDSETPLVCDTKPWSAVHLDMVQGQEVRVRVSTDIFWRSIMAVRVTPERVPDEPEPADEDPVVELVEPMPEAEPEPMPEPEAEPMPEPEAEPEAEPEPAPEPVSEPVPDTASAEVESHGAVEGGCGCQGGDPTMPLWLLVAVCTRALKPRRSCPR